ncbi:MAG TPA: hypothetical protein VGL53_12260 [Bryobacteraceae bacterium]|jgi:hypothetical protein
MRASTSRLTKAYQLANHVDPGDELLRTKIGECESCSHAKCPVSMITGSAEMIWSRTRTVTSNSLGVMNSLVDGMSKLSGQRIIVATSGGFLTGTLERDVDQLIDKARHAEVVINGLDSRGVYVEPCDGLRI